MNKLVRVAAFILFAIGALSGMLLGGATTVAGLESDFYFGFGYQADESLKDLDCPIILTGDDVGTVVRNYTLPIAIVGLFLFIVALCLEYLVFR